GCCGYGDPYGPFVANVRRAGTCRQSHAAPCLAVGREAAAPRSTTFSATLRLAWIVSFPSRRGCVRSMQLLAALRNLVLLVSHRPLRIRRGLRRIASLCRGIR